MGIRCKMFDCESNRGGWCSEMYIEIGPDGKCLYYVKKEAMDDGKENSV